MRDNLVHFPTGEQIKIDIKETTNLWFETWHQYVKEHDVRAYVIVVLQPDGETYGYSPMTREQAGLACASLRLIQRELEDMIYPSDDD